MRADSEDSPVNNYSDLLDPEYEVTDTLILNKNSVNFGLQITTIYRS